MAGNPTGNPASPAAGRPQADCRAAWTCTVIQSLARAFPQPHVPRLALQAEIKGAYRRLAKQCHPDMNPTANSKVNLLTHAITSKLGGRVGAAALLVSQLAPPPPPPASPLPRAHEPRPRERLPSPLARGLQVVARRFQQVQAAYEVRAPRPQPRHCAAAARKPHACSAIARGTANSGFSGG